MSDPAYSASEMMIAVAARMLTGARTVFVGVGLPNISCNLARVTVAPDMELIYESGVYGARPERLPLSIGDPTLVSGAVSVVSMADLFGLYLQRCLVEIALLGGAQIDKHGNLNSVPPQQVTVERASIERDVVQPAGANYIRITVTDHTRPLDDEVDRFILAVRSASRKCLGAFSLRSRAGTNDHLDGVV